MTQFDARLARWESLDHRGSAPSTPAAPTDSIDPTIPLAASIATSDAQRRAAARLVTERYAWRGYAVDDCGMRSAGVTLIASAGRRILGTLSVRADGPAGLAADDSYSEVIDALRRRGCTVCELTRLAIDAAADWRPTLGALVGLAYTVSRGFHAASDVVVEVNPRHERFYRRMFGFVTAGGRRTCPRVEAPAVLLRLDLECFARRMPGWSTLTVPVTARSAASNA
jgi:hypothetical protein